MEEKVTEKLLFVDKNGNVESKLGQVCPKEKLFNENWLQELLIANPDLIPIDDIDPSMGSLIPLGREVSVTAGSIDNIYSAVDGTVCIIETKLWRNPEAHRTVVAQIIDYAKDLYQMSLSEFKSIIEKSQINGQRPSFNDRISKHISKDDIIEFESKVQESLKYGRFLMLVVGDKIYPEVAMILETIQSAPNLEFKIGLVELRVYRKSTDKLWPILFIPKVVGKTYEVTRAVVRIAYEEKKPDVETTSVESATKTDVSTTDKKTFLSSMPEDYAGLFAPVFDQWIKDNIVINWGKVGFGVKFFWEGKLRSIVDIYPDSMSLVTDGMMKRRKYPIEPYHKYKNEINRISAAQATLSENRRYVRCKDIDTDEFMALLKATDRIIRDFKKLEKI
jgi:hypothetical protein